MSASVTALLGTATPPGDGSWILGVLVCLALYALLSSGKNWVRWQYTQDGQTHHTDWYDADTHYLWQDPQDPTHYAICPREDS